MLTAREFQVFWLVSKGSTAPLVLSALHLQNRLLLPSIFSLWKSRHAFCDISLLSKWEGRAANYFTEVYPVGACYVILSSKSCDANDLKRAKLA